MHDLTVRAPIYVPLLLIEDAGLQKIGERQTMRKEMDQKRLVIALNSRLEILLASRPSDQTDNLPVRPPLQ